MPDDLQRLLILSPIALLGMGLFWVWGRDLPRLDRRRTRGSRGDLILFAFMAYAGVFFLQGMMAGRGFSPQVQRVAHFLGVVALILGFHKLHSPNWLALKPTGATLRHIVVGIAVYLMVLPGVLFLHYWFVRHFDPDESIQESMRQFLRLRAEGDAFELGSLVIYVGLVVPLWEELLFRGMLQTDLRAILRSRWSGWAARWSSMVLVAVLFTVIHPIYAQGTILVLAVALGWVRDYSGALWAPLSFHVCHNLLTFLSAELLS